VLDHLSAIPVAPARVVVLGARGIIGRALCARLGAEAVPTLGLGSSELDLLATDAPTRLADLLREDDALVVLSALTPDKGRDIATLMTNLRMAEAVCAAITRRPVAQVIYLSSDAVYRMGPDLITEDTPADPADLYGVMHKAREVLLAATVKPAQLAILRCTMVLAAFDTHNSYGPNRFRHQARAEGRITLGGEGEETRDHILVDDVAELIRLTINHRGHGLLNAATGVSWPFADVARMVAAQFDPPTALAFTPRTNPITHRHFDITATRLAFPKLRFTPLSEAIARVHREEASTA
jgi:nucleoside-diphosphate-sugar epimerase